MSLQCYNSMAKQSTNNHTSTSTEALLIKALVRLDVESVDAILTSKNELTKGYIDYSWGDKNTLRPFITLPLAWDALIKHKDLWKSNKVINDISQSNATIKRLLSEHLSIDWENINKKDTPGYLASIIDSRTDNEILLEVINKNLHDARRHYIDVDIQFLLAVMRVDKERAIFCVGKGAPLTYDYEKSFHVNDHLKSRINTNTKLLAHLTRNEHHRSFRGDITTEGKEILINTAAYCEMYFALNNIGAEQVRILKQYARSKSTLVNPNAR